MAFHFQAQDHTLSSSMILMLLLTLQATMSYAANPSEDALLRLKQSLSNSRALSSWDPLTTACDGGISNWDGIICSRNDNVFGLKLENMSLSGKINMDILAELRYLRVVSFMNNKLEGQMPNMKNLRGLRFINLSKNLFQGPIDPQAFDGCNRLKKLMLASNKFTGPIPISLTNAPRLIELRLEDNQFEGKIPDFASTSFQDFSMANNNLEGPIPFSLSRMNPDAFVGNKGLCGLPLKPCNLPTNPQAPSTTPPSHFNSKSIISIIIALVVVLLVILFVVALMFIKRNTKSKPRMQAQMKELPSKKVVTVAKDRGTTEGSVKGANMRAKGDGGRLCFVKEDGDKFDLPDLLRASAEILGSGCFGSSYKAILLNGTMMVVKRFKQMNNVGREEFQEHMKRIGRVEHKNVVSLVAYYYRRDEKLLVSKFVQMGSLAAHLHGGHSKGQPKLDWPTRLNIIKGVARGLSYLYKQLSLLTTPHGHLKSSNVLLDESMNPLIHDYGLIPLINQESAQLLMVAYKTPEYISTARINKKTDVWSLGILIIEVMTGRFPSTYLQQGGKEDLSSWVKEVAGDAKASQVFDKNMGSSPNSEGEMQKMLSIGLTCCESNVDKRWDIKEACERIQEVKEKDHDDDFYSVASHKSDPNDRRTSRGMSDDFTVNFT
ncbi:hypothetical protein V2J09_019374 [Rumex salicifolius]